MEIRGDGHGSIVTQAVATRASMLKDLERGRLRPGRDVLGELREIAAAG